MQPLKLPKFTMIFCGCEDIVRFHLCFTFIKIGCKDYANLHKGGQLSYVTLFILSSWLKQICLL